MATASNAGAITTGVVFLVLLIPLRGDGALDRAFGLGFILAIAVSYRLAALVELVQPSWAWWAVGPASALLALAFVTAIAGLALGILGA